MPTEGPVPLTPPIQLDNADPPDDEQINSYALIKSAAERHSGPLWLRLSPEFAKLQGSNVLLVMGIVLFVLGCEAFVIGHTTVAEFFTPLGLLAVVVATRLGQLVMIKIGVAIAKFAETNATNDVPGPDATHDA